MNTLYRTKNGFIVCNICGDQVNGIHLLYTHIGRHMNALAKDSDSKGFAVLFCINRYTGFMYVVNYFPQLCLMKPINIETFVKLLENSFLGNKLNIGFINNLFNQPPMSYSDMRRDVINIITTTNYHCGLCGGIYDCGLPSIEIAAKHAIKCYENLNRPNIK